MKISRTILMATTCALLLSSGASAFQSGGGFNQTAKPVGNRVSKDKSLNVVNLLNRKGALARDFYRSGFMQIMGLVFFDPGTPDIGACQKEVLNYHLPELTKTYLNLDEMKDDLALAYAQTYTEEEIAWMLQFYATPFGERMLQKQFQLNERITRIVAERYGSLKPQFTKMYGVVAERCGSGNNRSVISLPSDAPALGNDILSLPAPSSSATDPLSPTRAAP